MELVLLSCIPASFLQLQGTGCTKLCVFPVTLGADILVGQVPVTNKMTETLLGSRQGVKGLERCIKVDLGGCHRLGSLPEQTRKRGQKPKASTGQDEW